MQKDMPKTKNRRSIQIPNVFLSAQELYMDAERACILPGPASRIQAPSWNEFSNIDPTICDDFGV